MSLDLSISANAALKSTLESAARNNAALRTMISDNVLTTEELRQITTLEGLDVDIKIQVLNAMNDQGTTPDSTSTAGGENIDKAKTLEFQQKIRTAQQEYKEKLDKETELKSKLDKANGEFETAREDLGKAVDKMTGAAENASASVNTQITKILLDAKSGKLTKDQAKSRLNGISVPGLNGEKLTLNSLQSDVENLAGKISSLSDVYAEVASKIGELAKTYGNFLEVDPLTVCVDISGKIIVNIPGSEGPAATGADGIASLDVAKFASMATDDLAKALEGEYKGLFDSIKGSGNTELTSQEAAKVIKDLIAAKPADKGNPADFGTIGAKSDVNILNGISRADLDAAAKKAQDAKKPPPTSCDPYEITIDGKVYQFVKENGDGKWDPADLFGFTDQKDDIFRSMKDADLDKNGQLTGEELAKLGVRLVAKEGGKLQVNDSSKDFDLSKIDNIDLTKLRGSDQNDGNVGTFGNFDLKLTDGRTIEGKQTFEELSTLQKLFNGIGKFFSGLVQSVVNKFQLDPQTVEFYSKLGEFSQETSKLDAKGTSITIDSADAALSSSEENIEASSYDLKSMKDEDPKAKEKPAEPKEPAKTEENDLKKKKLEEPML